MIEVYPEVPSIQNRSSRLGSTGCKQSNQKRDSNIISWEEHYRTIPIGSERISERKRLQASFLNEIVNQTIDLDAKLVMEIGVGTGGMSYLINEMLSERNHFCTVAGYDLSYQLLCDTIDYVRNRDSNILGIVGDSLSIPFSAGKKTSTILYHQGLLEHYNPDIIRLFLSEQLRVSQRVVFSVPAKGYPFEKGLLGNENLWSLDEWKEILEPFNVLKGYSYGAYPGENYHHCFVVSKK